MKTSTILVACLLLSAVVKAQKICNELPQLELEPFATGFSYPIDLANAGDSRLFVVERLGKIWVIDSNGNKLSSEPFLDITNEVFTVFPQEYDERGLLGLAFHPNYPTTPYFYVNYIGNDSNSHISRFTVDPNNPNKAIKSSELRLLQVVQPKGKQFVNHKAGCVKFGKDGYLYTTFGDGGFMGDPFNNAQNPRVLLGKIIRIDVDHPSNGKNYGIPADNPYVNVDKWKDEIWATGLRNPFCFSFDRSTGDLWLPDVGQNSWEEINMHRVGMAGGENYGWSCYEGYHNYKFDSCDYNGAPYTFPIVEYGHTEKPCAAITGGFVYRGSRYPKMYGKYFYNDYCNGKYSCVFLENRSWMNIVLLDEDDLAYVRFGEDNKGELYTINTVTGEIEHLIDESEPHTKAMNKVADPGTTADAAKDLNLKLYPNPNHGQFTVEVNALQQQDYVINVTNVYGNKIISETKKANAGINRWSFYSRQLQKGMYMLSIQTTRGSINQTFVVE